MIEYRRLRAPRNHGLALSVPALSQSSAILQGNLKLNSSVSLSIGGMDLDQLRFLARSQLLRQAGQYTAEYRDVNVPEHSGQIVVMSGHQPTLFHPGVWFKNFVLSQLAIRQRGIAVNLIIDNDIATNPGILVPNLADTPNRQFVPIDRPADLVPYEVRRIQEPSFFRGFADRAAEAIRPIVEAPLVERLWNHLPDQLTLDDNYGQVLAACRHRLESDANVETLEIPLSRVVETESFARFAGELLSRSSELAEIYNHTLVEYREVHRIRSRSHPVPTLIRTGEFVETPFWIWTHDNPFRKRLFVKEIAGGLLLTDRDRIECKIPSTGLYDPLLELRQKGIFLRPRALITTLYGRLVLSDLFVHGIGGAKYDQLTDAIANRLWSISLPKYLTVTATLHLPTGHRPATDQDITRLKVLLRDFKYHPERHLDENLETATALAADKANWINQAIVDRRQRHEQIDRCNRSLGQLLADETRVLEEKLTSLIQQQEFSQIACSREYSFCLFPIELIEQLSRLAEIPDAAVQE